MHTITVSTVTSSSPEYAEVFALRDEVLRKPLGMSLKDDDLSRDHTDIILAGKIDGKVVACLLLHRVNEEQVQLRQMAVYPQWQGSGVGRQLVTAAELYAADKGYAEMMMHARKTAVGFYSSMQYTTIGNEFMEVGIPHLIMKKDIRQ
jgi:predicted GNAT family N-acyltransferase